MMPQQNSKDKWRLNLVQNDLFDFKFTTNLHRSINVQIRHFEKGEKLFSQLFPNKNIHLGYSKQLLLWIISCLKFLKSYTGEKNNLKPNNWYYNNCSTFSNILLKHLMFKNSYTKKKKLSWFEIYFWFFLFVHIMKGLEKYGSFKCFSW